MMNFPGQVVRFLLVSSLALSFAALLAGCRTKSNRFTIELEPANQGMNRSLTFTSSSDVAGGEDAPSYPEAELKKLDEIAAVYGVGKVSDLEDVTNEFSSVFTNRMPQDIGGQGEYRRWETSLGQASVYVERLRGSDDLLASIESWNRNFDTIVDHMITWLESEIGNEEGFDHLREFMTNDLRQDLKNLGLYVWSLRFHENEVTEDVLIRTSMRAAQYFCEREYFAIEDIPEIVRATTEYEATDHPQRLLRILQRLIASKMGIEENQRIPNCLSFIGHEKAFAKSVNEYYENTAEYKELLKDWEANGQGEPKPNLAEVLNEVFWRDIFRVGVDIIHVKLKSRTEPFLTNGEWDDEDHVVKWSKSIPVLDTSDTSYPMLAYAFWVEPNEESQMKHFGRVVLGEDDESLVKYCFWYHGLNGSESKQWDSFLATITPDADIKSKLQAFRFDHEPPAIDGDDSNKDLAGSVRPLILAGLEKE